ncbi:MAG: hypothetical protein ACLUE2_05235 [Bacteroides cellulosilyticus]
MKGNDSYATGAWLGFVGGDVEAIIDLGQETEIKRVATNAIVDHECLDYGKYRVGSLCI